jgi:hypothetical protein
MKYKGDISAILINASRIGNFGGLKQFTEAILKCLPVNAGITVVRPAGISLMTEHQQRLVPEWLASPMRVSKLRPVLWWMYCALGFPVEPKRRILSTTSFALSSKADRHRS